MSIVKFETELIDKSKIQIQVSIESQPLSLLPNVYNMAFGPLTENNEIDDHARLTHVDHSKMFSTIMSTCLKFLRANPNKSLGLDGSTNSRAYLYFRIIQNNYEILSEQFDIYGVKLYMRVLRNDNDESHSIDSKDIISNSTRITRGDSIKRDKMYNYFFFKIKDETATSTQDSRIR